jgi:Helix-hairpin-helix motif
MVEWKRPSLGDRAELGSSLTVEDRAVRAAANDAGRPFAIPPLPPTATSKAARCDSVLDSAIGAAFCAKPDIGRKLPTCKPHPTPAALPGIGPDHAQSIIDVRPFASKEDLLKKKVISHATYKKIRTSSRPMVPKKSLPEEPRH